MGGETDVSGGYDEDKESVHVGLENIEPEADVASEKMEVVESRLSCEWRFAVWITAGCCFAGSVGCAKGLIACL